MRHLFGSLLIECDQKIQELQQAQEETNKCLTLLDRAHKFKLYFKLTYNGMELIGNKTTNRSSLLDKDGQAFNPTIIHLDEEPQTTIQTWVSELEVSLFFQVSYALCIQ